MANEELLAILKQDVDRWNKWRKDHFGINLSDFGEVYLDVVDFSKADFSDGNLSGANLSNANLNAANLSRSNLSQTHVSEADLTDANLTGADLSGAFLFRTDLSRANLRGADLSEATLILANLSEAKLSKSNLTGAKLSGAIFGNIDFSETIGLENVHHTFSSIIGIDTLQRSKGKISAKFLRGCGLSDVDIEYAKLCNPDLSTQEIDDILYKIHDLRARQTIQISPLFISYSRKDDVFVNRLEVELNKRGIRFWRDIHDAKAGRLETQIEHAIRHNPTVLLVLSESALDSDWVQHEVRKARGLEKELGRDVLCPVTLDDGWRSSRWPERVMDQVMEYNILDFSQWQDDVVFQKMFVKLLDGLQLFYKK